MSNAPRRRPRLGALMGMTDRDGRPILADTTIEAAARQLDLAEAIAEVYKTDPEFLAPRRVYERLRRAAPDLLL